MLLVAATLIGLAVPSLPADERPQCSFDDSVVMVDRFSDLPAKIRTDVLEEGRVADVGEPSFEIGARDSWGAPGRRFLSAGHRGDRWFVRLGHSVVDHDDIFGFLMNGSAEKPSWFRVALFWGAPCASIDAILEGVQNTDFPERDQAPIAYRHPETGLLIYVERDGRHVSVIDREGKVLWSVDPFVDGKLDPYRMEHPVIRYVGPMGSFIRPELNRDHVGIGFTSSQFGRLSLVDGSFHFMGQD